MVGERELGWPWCRRFGLAVLTCAPALPLGKVTQIPARPLVHHWPVVVVFFLSGRAVVEVSGCDLGVE